MTYRLRLFCFSWGGQGAEHLWPPCHSGCGPAPFLLNQKKKTLEKRITGRRLCENCNTIYNINEENSRPAVESICDNCGGKLYQRSDDNLEAFKTRYEMYLEKTKPIIEHYQKQNVLTEVNGNDTVENIFNQIDEIINK